ncbi:MAG: dockerin type I domain-containing protein [Pirellulales bacterium]
MMTRHRRRRGNHRKLLIENLQPRRLMTVESGTWTDGGSLRLSFVADGTKVSGHTSDLNAVMSSSAAGPAWKEAVAHAFQIWAQYAAINVGVVSDDGSALGTQGATHGDDRFGDIRVAGIPMAADTWAAAVEQNMTSAGSWAGDMLFNTDADWNNKPDDLLRVALHEAGHVLGLPHSDDIASPMHTHGIPQSLIPTAADIALLQQVYGTRGPDVNELAKSNDVIGDATRIRFDGTSSHWDGKAPLVHYGEISTASDKDIYFYDATFSGATTFRVASAGLSQLQFKMSILDKNGNVLAQGTAHDASGGDLKLHLSNVAVGQKVYIKVEADGDPSAAIGSYAVIIQPDATAAYSDTEVLRVAQKAGRWFASSAQTLSSFDVKSLFGSVAVPKLNDDNGADDNPLDAPRVSPYVDSASRRGARIIGSIGSATDDDNYRFRSPHIAGGQTMGLMVQVDALERDSLVPKVSVFDSLLNPVAAEVQVNGNGEVRLWIASVQSNQDYTVRIESDVTGHATGNYEIRTSFQSEAPTANILTTKDLDALHPEQSAVWYVGRPQLFSLALAGSSTSASQESIWVVIYDQNKRPISTLATTVGELRTGPAVLLEPGTYYLQFGMRDSSGTASSATTHIDVYGDADINPIGPPAIDPGSTPAFACGDGSGQFCYPNNAPTTEPFVINSDPQSVLPTTQNWPVSTAPDLWFWNPTFLRTNPVQPLDSSGDGFITPLDALIVINMINSRNPGLLPAPPVVVDMVDVNADGFLTPLDALLIINRLNSLGSGEGEQASPDAGTGATIFGSSDLNEQLRECAWSASSETGAPKRKDQSA